MIIRKEFIKRDIGGDTILVPTGTTVYDYNGLFALNELGSFLWDLLPQAENADALVAAVLEAYDVDEATARQDIGEFLDKLRAMQII